MRGLKEEECRIPVGVEEKQTEVLAGKLRQTWKVTHLLQTMSHSLLLMANMLLLNHTHMLIHRNTHT